MNIILNATLYIRHFNNKGTTLQIDQTTNKYGLLVIVAEYEVLTHLPMDKIAPI